MRQKKTCRFSVRANRREEGDWELDAGKCRWLHSHGPKEKDGDSRKSESAQVEGGESSSNESEDESESEEEPLIKQTARTRELRLSSLHTTSCAERRLVCPVSTSPQIRFDVKTSSKTVLDIISRREEVFALQRRLESCTCTLIKHSSQSHGRLNDFPSRRTASRQQTSEKIVEDELESLPIPAGAPKAVYCYEHAKFLQFAELAKVPPYPITPPLIALYLSYKASLSAGTQVTSRAWLNRLHKSLDATWKDQHTYEALEKWKDVEEGIREFMKERADSRVRRT